MRTLEQNVAAKSQKVTGVRVAQTLLVHFSHFLLSPDTFISKGYRCRLCCGKFLPRWLLPRKLCARLAGWNRLFAKKDFSSVFSLLSGFGFGCFWSEIGFFKVGFTSCTVRFGWKFDANGCSNTQNLQTFGDQTLLESRHVCRVQKLFWSPETFADSRHFVKSSDFVESRHFFVKSVEFSED